MSKTNDNRKQFGQWLRRRRESVGLGLREAARSLRVSGAYLSQLELGRRAIPWRRFAALARVLGSPEYDLHDAAGRCPHCGRMP